jgi:CRISPR-associated endonuclease Csn1
MRIFGLDGGIASIGWAVLDTDASAGRIIACGSRCFDAPETHKRKPTSQVRSEKRGLRRVIRRRRQRMSAVRRLFHQHGLLADAGRDALRSPGLDPWQLRDAGLQRALSGAELAVALGHIAAHRGFRSNSKRDRGANAADDTSKMLKAIEATCDRLAGYQTVGAMFAQHPDYKLRKRNRSADYSHTVLRADLEHEVRTLFAQQRRFGSQFSAEPLEQEFTNIAFYQRPLQDSDSLVGPCPFEAGEKRTARRAYSFELFRLFSRVNSLTLTRKGGEPRITAVEAAKIVADFGRQKRITFKSVRKLLDLDPGVRFEGIDPKEEDRDIVARSGNAAEGTATIRAAVGEGSWRQLRNTPAVLDRIAEIITFRDNPDSIRAGIAETGIEAFTVDALMQHVQAGGFAQFKGAGHISAKAARNILPGLSRGLVYSEACAEAGYDHATRPAQNLADIRNPVARKALGEMLKQVRAMVREYGLPDAMHVELARDVGKSAEERDEITRSIEKRNKQRDRERAEFRELLGKDPNAEELLRFELWKEQNCRCLYTDEEIQPEWLIATDNRAQVDHILPWSRFGDDSFMNKTLCLARANQEKRGRTPHEWIADDKGEDAWNMFIARVEGCKEMKGRKKRGFYLRRNAADVEENFRNRNLGDTRYATRVLLDVLSRMYPQDGRRHVLARPGALTDKLRRAWGLQALKKDAQGNRLRDDRHHAVDAIVLAATTESMVQRLTVAFQKSEDAGRARDFSGKDIPAPWPSFRADVDAAFNNVFVSRPERRRVPGEAHAATIRQVREVEGKPAVFVRKAVEALTEADLERIPVPAPYGKIVDPAKLRGAMIDSLRAWLAAGKPKDAPPRMPNGDLIRKVRVETNDKPGISIRGGTADRGEMVRVDVFREVDRRGRARFHMVPVYPHQIVTMKSPPNKAVVAHKSEQEWLTVSDTWEFLFSLYQNSLIEVQRRRGESLLGYFKGLDVNGAQIDVASSQSQLNRKHGIGTKTLTSFSKLGIDRLGRTSEILRETRIWRGEVCT